MTYEPNPWDPTTNAGIIVPGHVAMELKCKRPNSALSTSRGDEIVVYRPLVVYKTFYEPDRYVFQPMNQPDPAWQIIRDFIPGSYVLEAYDIKQMASLFMWDIAGQNEFRPGEIIAAGECSVLR